MAELVLKMPTEVLSGESEHGHAFALYCDGGCPLVSLVTLFSKVEENLGLRTDTKPAPAIHNEEGIYLKVMPQMFATCLAASKEPNPRCLFVEVVSGHSCHSSPLHCNEGGAEADLVLCGLSVFKRASSLRLLINRSSPFLGLRKNAGFLIAAGCLRAPGL
eukprot:549651-Amphidinium_carterae.2